MVLGGGADGVGYVRRLLRASAAGRLRTGRVLVLDRDPGCEAARLADPRVELQAGDWNDWLDARLHALGPDDQLVPYHWAPHVLVEDLARQARRAGAAVARGWDLPATGHPFERPTRQGDRALSYASWSCPPACIEPALCPHTRGPKDWSLAADLERPRLGTDAAIVFRSLHLIWGVATIPIAAIAAARALVLAGLGAGARRYLVATASHCHALATRLTVVPVARSG